MPTTRLSRKRQKREHENSAQHELPSEVLSNIFVICSRLSEFDVEMPYGQHACHKTLVAVCRRWRAVALETAELWSRVTLDELPPWPRSALYLSRSGPTAPLDIEIDMTEEFWAETENATLDELKERAQDALAFIVSHGGVTSRWRFVWITTDIFAAHRVLIDFLASSAFPALRHLELGFRGPYEFDDDDELEMEEATLIEPTPLFQTRPPQLHTVILQGVPNPFIFGHPDQPSLSGLTHFRISLVGEHPDLNHLHTLLSANRRLVTLSLDMDVADSSAPHKIIRRIPKITLPLLQELALLHVRNTSWPLNLLMMLDAPNVDHLRLKLSDCDRNYTKMLQYLADGGKKSNPQPLFPSVTHLMAWLDPSYDTTEALKTLLATHSKITLLELFYTSPAALLTKPWLAPKLEHLRVTGCRGQELKKVVSARSRAKIPLKIVEVDYLSGGLIKKPERRYLKGKVDFAFVRFPEAERVTFEVSDDDHEELHAGYERQYDWD